MGIYILKLHQLKKIVVLLVTIGFLGTGFLPIISSSNLSYKQNDILSIGFEVAQKVAETKIYLSKSLDYHISEAIKIKSTDDSPIMYIFFLNPTGYIVVPANKNLPPIIAYSFENEFGDISEENILLQLLKADISSRIDHIDLISENIIKNRDEQWQKYSSLVKINQQNLVTTVGPLLDTKWSQNAPYNNFCPIDLVSGTSKCCWMPSSCNGTDFKLS